MVGSGPHVLALAVLVAAAAGAAGAQRSAAEVEREQLARLARRSVFFGHQSVGMNVLAGLERLAAERGVALRVAEVAPGAAIPAGTIGHAWVGENHRPETKLAAFAAAVDALPPPGVEIALVKLCYVDFSPATDPAALFARYQAEVDALARRHPGTTFVHVTAPLTTVQGGAKGFAKRLLGRAPYGVIENQRREAFNALLRAAYRGRAPIFDLAAAEATRPDGGAEAFTVDGRAVPALAPAYTDDGGHLNAAGQAAAARALLAALDALPPRPAPAGAP